MDLGHVASAAAALLALLPAGAVQAEAGPVVFSRSAELPADDREFNHLYPGCRPGDGQVCHLNPPLFSWLYYLPGKDGTEPRHVDMGPLVGQQTPLMRFRFQIARDPQFKQAVVDKADLWYPWYNTLAPLEGGQEWYWRVGYSEKASGKVQWCRPRRFTIAKDALVWDRSLLADREYLESKGIGRQGHPRYIFNGAEMPRVRALLKERPDLVRRVRGAADAAMQSAWWRDFPEDDATPWQSKAHGQAAGGLMQVALAYLVTQDAEYLTARERFLRMARWWDKAGQPGSTSPEGAGTGSRGINGRCAKALAAGYDWMYERWTEDERAILRRGLEWRIRHQERTSGCAFNDPHVYQGQPLGPGMLPFRTGSHGYEDHLDCVPASIAICDESEAAREAFESNVNYLLGVGVSGVGNPDEGFRAGLANYGLWHWRCLLEALVPFEASFPEVGFGRNPRLREYAECFLYCRPPGVRCASWGNYSANYDSFANYIPIALWRTAHLTRQRLYRKWAQAYNRAHKNLDLARDDGLTEAYLEMLKPWRDDLKEPDLPGGYARVYRLQGFVAVSSTPPFSAEDMRRGVGMTFASRPGGKALYSHNFCNEGTFDIRAYGEVIATGGGSSINWSATGIVSAGHNCILFDGDGQGGPGPIAGDVVQPVTRGRWGWPDYPRVARIVAFQTHGHTTYFCGDCTNAYRLDHVKRVRRHVLFVRKKYFVIFDEVRTSRPSRITWVYHVDQDVPLALARETVGFDYRMGKVAVKVRQAGTPQELECVNYQDEAWMRNPLSGSDTVLRDWQEKHPGGRLMKHNLWVTTRASKTAQNFLSVIYPHRVGSPEPEIERLDGATVRVTAGDEADVISFDARTPHPATVIVKVNEIGATTDVPRW